ncbi:hypothetical protein IHE61_07050 [Streptomyces sp. GKU 257-1]|nr:hypothetical protein [Streptomyces sp. GKU 257-1]
MQEVLGEQVGVLNSLYPDGVARLWGSTPTSQVSNEKAKALKGATCRRRGPLLR